MYAAAEVVDLIQFINWIIRDTDFNGDYHTEHVGFILEKLIVQGPEAGGGSPKSVAGSLAKSLKSKFGDSKCCGILAFVYIDMKTMTSGAFRSEKRKNRFEAYLMRCTSF